MRTVTKLPHEEAFVGVLWNQAAKTGNYDNWGRLPIDTIVIHSMDGTLDGSTSWFRRKGGGNSAHYGVSYSGRIVNWIPENCVAYGAGSYPVNQRAINIEFEDLGDNMKVRPDTLYAMGSRLILELSLAYNIPLDRLHIYKHNEVLESDGKRVNTACPGSLDINRLVDGAKALLTPPVDEEPLVSHMMKKSVFSNMVTKSGEYDALWKSLELPENIKGNSGSHLQVLAYIQTFINQEVERRATPIVQEPVVNQPTQAIDPAPAPQSPTTPSISIWRKDIRDVLGEILAAVRGQK